MSALSDVIDSCVAAMEEPSIGVPVMLCGVVLLVSVVIAVPAYVFDDANTCRRLCDDRGVQRFVPGNRHTNAPYECVCRELSPEGRS